MTKVLTMMVVFLLVACTSYAGSLKCGTGGINGNYYPMGVDVYNYCNEVVDPATSFEIMESGGSVANLLGMGNKEFSMGLVQEDVLQYFAKQDPRKVNINRYKIVTGLHMETVHLLIPKNFKPKKVKGKKSLWGKMKFWGGDDAPPMKVSLEMLEGQDVASWGGSVISAKALMYFMGVEFNIIDVPADKRATINVPIIVVGGQPYKPVTDYLATGKFNLVSIDYSKIQNSAPFYLSVNASYDVAGKAVSVQTIGVRALLVGKAFRKEARNVDMIAIAQCVSDNLADLADDPDTNPNWNSVYELEADGGQTNWSYFPVK